MAVNIAAELAAQGKPVILVDADSYGASVAASLGLLDESAGLAQACRLADQGFLDAESLKRIAAPVFTRLGSFRVLTGITRADRWTELRASALSSVLEHARDIAEIVVVDAGFASRQMRNSVSTAWLPVEMQPLSAVSNWRTPFTRWAQPMPSGFHDSCVASENSNEQYRKRLPS